MRIYLDNNATTPMHPEVLSVLERTSREVFGNASSIHAEGQAARRVIEQARESVARLIGATAREIVFTSGGTECNNAAILGAIGPAPRCHIVTTAIEHPSVVETVRRLERDGCEATYVPPARSGAVDAAAVLAAIRPETRLVAVMAANNETGVLQPVAAIGRACRDRGIHFHCDAVQAAGRVPVDVAEIGCDTLALSAHKIQGPKGIGALFVRNGVSLQTILSGGAQERRRRAGTEAVPLAAAFGAAAALPLEAERIGGLRDAFEAGLRSALDVSIQGEGASRLPNTSSVTFAGGDAEGIVIALDLEGVAASTGSACSSGRIEPSAALLAMGLTAAEARSTVRFSFGRANTGEEVDRVVALLARIGERFRGAI